MSEDLGQLFERYAVDYMAGEAEAIADLCATPFLAVRGGSPIHLADRAALVEHFSAVMAGYRRSGAASAQIAALDVLAQGDSAAVATVRWDVRTQSGELIRDFRTSYQLLGPDPWRIFGYVNHDVVRSDGS